MSVLIHSVLILTLILLLPQEQNWLRKHLLINLIRWWDQLVLVIILIRNNGGVVLHLLAILFRRELFLNAKLYLGSVTFSRRLLLGFASISIVINIGVLARWGGSHSLRDMHSAVSTTFFALWDSAYIVVVASPHLIDDSTVMIIGDALGLFTATWGCHLSRLSIIILHHKNVGRGVSRRAWLLLLRGRVARYYFWVFVKVGWGSRVAQVITWIFLLGRCGNFWFFSNDSINSLPDSFFIVLQDVMPNYWKIRMQK